MDHFEFKKGQKNTAEMLRFLTNFDHFSNWSAPERNALRKFEKSSKLVKNKKKTSLQPEIAIIFCHFLGG